MAEKSLNLTRRKFMVASSAAIAAPLFTNMAGMVPEAKGAEKTYDFIDKRSCDLVVLGGGGSGMVAAVRAAQLTGQKVVVLEKSSETGGCARYANTFRTFGSKWQAKRNLPETTTEYACAMMDFVYWLLDAKLVSNCLRGTGQFFDWLCEQGGDIEDRFYIGKYVFALIDSEPVGPQMKRDESGKGYGGFVMDMMKEKCREYGVEVLTKHPVVDVEVKNGKIVAVVAKSEEGYVRVACKACILSTGSWINDEEILNKYAPEFADAKPYMGGGPHMSLNNTGDGIALAEKVGAFVDYDSFCLRLMGPTHGMGGEDKVFNAMAQSPYIISVNLDGKRYCSEPVRHLGIFDGGFVQMQQPQGQSYDIFNENTIAATLKFQKSPEAAKKPEKPIEEVPTYKKYLPETMEEIQSNLKESLAKGSAGMFKADTLEELADKIGVNKKNFLETVRNYNEGCEKGVDWGYFKSKDCLAPINKPPYYAFLGGLGTDGAFGGVLVNPEMQAYRPDRSLVEGLYVTGDFATGRHINFHGVKRHVLNDLSWAFSSGFLAGTNAAKYLERH